MNFNQLINQHKNCNFLIICAGGTLRDRIKQVQEFIKQNNPIVIGINKMTHITIPNYHLWTNQERYFNYGSCISTDSKLILSSRFPIRLVTTHWFSDYYQLDYDDKPGYDNKFIDGRVQGRFRTAGCLAIYLAHLMGAKEINIVGMDGFTLHNRAELLRGHKSHHCYGMGYTDDAEWEQCKEKDEIVYKSLKDLFKQVRFKILTPTVFSEFYSNEL